MDTTLRTVPSVSRLRHDRIKDQMLLACLREGLGEHSASLSDPGPSPTQASGQDLWNGAGGLSVSEGRSEPPSCT